MRQAIWQIYLLTPKHIPRPTFDVESLNAVHQADIILLPRDRRSRERKSRYALTVVDVASRFKAVEPLTSNDSSRVSRPFQNSWVMSQEMEKYDVRIRRGNLNVHSDQGIVEWFNRTLGKPLFTIQYSLEMNFKEGRRSTEWVKRLPEVLLALNSEVTRLTGKKPVDAIKDKSVDAKSSTTYLRPIGLKEKRLTKCEISLCRWSTGRWSEASYRSNMVS